MHRWASTPTEWAGLRVVIGNARNAARLAARAETCRRPRNSAGTASRHLVGRRRHFGRDSRRWGAEAGAALVGC